MHLTFDARIDGPLIHCTIGTDVPLARATWCFSLMAAGHVLSGGILTRTLAGYCEVALPDLVPGQAHVVVLSHANAAYGPRNRAWLPLGGYLRLADGTCHPLPDLPAGVRDAPLSPVPPVDGLCLLPQPTSFVPWPGQLVVRGFAATGPICDSADALSRRLGFGPFLTGDGPRLTLQDSPSMAEGYALHIRPDGVALHAADRTGFLYGAITLMTLIRTLDGVLPCGLISDAPRFGWRGQHLDCARHYFSTDTILRLLDLMALLKLNRFHWHFADDESFRLEIDSYPALWQKTAFRGEGLAIPGTYGGGIRAGGTYGRTDVACVLARAADLGIMVIPEIEVPAHSYALNLALPGLRDPGDNGAEVSVHGYAMNLINPAMAKTWDVIPTIAEEVASWFPGSPLHLGCDEAPHGAWDGSPAIMALKAQEGLQTQDDVQGWMMARLAGHLATKGIRTAAWEEAAKGANGGIGHGAILFSWTGQGPGIAAARAGHDVVMCPAPHTYMDLAHTADTDDWGARWAGVLPLEATVDWSPVPANAPDIADRVIGVQGCFWGEFTTADWQMEAMLAPRILGIAAKGWESEGRTDGPALRALAAHYRGLFDAMGWRWHHGA
jgi:hexosaminidase